MVLGKTFSLNSPKSSSHFMLEHNSKQEEKSRHESDFLKNNLQKRYQLGFQKWKTIFCKNFAFNIF